MLDALGIILLSVTIQTETLTISCSHIANRGTRLVKADTLVRRLVWQFGILTDSRRQGISENDTKLSWVDTITEDSPEYGYHLPSQIPAMGEAYRASTHHDKYLACAL